MIKVGIDVVVTDKQWVWTKKGVERWRQVVKERGLDPRYAEERRVGEPVYEHFRKTAPRSWYERGFIEEGR